MLYPTRIYIKTKHDSESNKTILPTINMFNNPFTTEFDNEEDKEETLTNNRKREGLDAVMPMDSTPLKDRGDPLPLQEKDLPDHLKDPKKPDTFNPEGEAIKFSCENSGWIML